MNKLLANQSGLTVIEVLIGSIIFLVGFSTVIALLAGMSQKASSRDLILAQTLGEQILTTTVEAPDPLRLATDTTVLAGGISFKIQRTVTLESEILKVRLQVKRRSARREILDLYYETVHLD